MNLIQSLLSILVNKSSTNNASNSTLIVLWVVAAIFIALALISFVFSYIFYKKKNIETPDISTVIDPFNFSTSKSKKWWIKYRSSGFFSLGVLFTLLSIGGIIFISTL